jgi:hypothetical protein
MKILTKVITNRQVQESNNTIPQEQFGFHKGWSTLHAIKNLLDKIEAIRTLRGKIVLHVYRVHQAI